MRSLKEIDQLKQSGYGQPKPRHGLKLLYWFATDCLYDDQNNGWTLRCDPARGDYGFHLFENRFEGKSGKLLPEGLFCYYVVGNLSKPASFNLPKYVREHYTGNRDNSNMDRIIIRIDNGWFRAIYVTEHSDRSKFKKWATFLINEKLITLIRHLSLDMFLQRTGYSPLHPNQYLIYPNNSQADFFPSSTTVISIPEIAFTGNRTPAFPNIQWPSQELSSGNRVVDIESGNVTQMNSPVISDDTTIPPTGILDRVRRCGCTIL